MKLLIASSDGSTDIFTGSASRILAGPVRDDEENKIIERYLLPYQLDVYPKL